MGANDQAQRGARIGRAAANACRAGQVLFQPECERWGVAIQGVIDGARSFQNQIVLGRARLRGVEPVHGEAEMTGRFGADHVRCVLVRERYKRDQIVAAIILRRADMQRKIDLGGRKFRQPGHG